MDILLVLTGFVAGVAIMIKAEEWYIHKKTGYTWQEIIEDVRKGKASECKTCVAMAKHISEQGACDQTLRKKLDHECRKEVCGGTKSYKCWILYFKKIAKKEQ